MPFYIIHYASPLGGVVFDTQRASSGLDAIALHLHSGKHKAAMIISIRRHNNRDESFDPCPAFI